MTTVKINPIADTYVDKANPNTNYGTSVNLRYRACRYWSTILQRIYMRFSLASIPSNTSITKAVLWLYPTYSSGFGSMYIRNVLDRTWTETAITWNNQPSFDTYPGTRFYKGPWPGNWDQFDITSYIQDQYNLGVDADFVIQGDESDVSCIGAPFASKEYSDIANRPYLEITYGRAIIEAIEATPVDIQCQEPCDVVIDITWKNNGDLPGNFTPSIIVSNVRIAPHPVQSLAVGATVKKRFTLTGLTTGTYYAKSDPSGITVPIRVTSIPIEPPIEPPIVPPNNGTGLLLIGIGLLAILLFKSKK